MSAPGEHPINVVVRRTGLSAHVLRQWENRYNAVTPRRSTANRRLYTDEDVDRLRLLSITVKTGHSIGKFPRLPDDTLFNYILEDTLVRQPSLPSIIDTILICGGRSSQKVTNLESPEAVTSVLDARELQKLLRKIS